MFNNRIHLPPLLMLFLISFLFINFSQGQSTSVLVEDINKNLTSGNIIKATQAADKLYKADKGKSKEFTVLTAKVAELAGDKATAVKRYLNYLALESSKNAKTEKALLYLVIHNANYEILNRFIKEHGTTEVAKVKGLSLFESLLKSGDAVGACELANLLVDSFQSQNVNNDIINQLRWNTRVFNNQESRAALFKFFTSAKGLNARSTYEVIRSFENVIPPGKLLLGVAQIQLKQGGPVNQSFSYYFNRITKLKIDQKAVALKFLEHDKLSADFYLYHDFLTFISRNPNVFKVGEGKLIDQSDVAAKIDRLIKTLKEPEMFKGQLSQLINDFASNYFAKESKDKFLAKYKMYLNPDYRELAKGLKGNSGLVKSIKSAIGGYRFTNDKKLNKALEGLKVADMIAGKDNSEDGQAVKLLFDSFLSHAQGRSIGEVHNFARFWVKYAPQSPQIWNTLIKTTIVYDSFPRDLVDEYVDVILTEKKISDEGRKFLVKLDSGVKDFEKLKKLRPLYSALGDAAIILVAKSNFKKQSLTEEILTVLKAVKDDISERPLNDILGSLGGQKSKKTDPEIDIDLVMSKAKGHSLSTQLSVASVIGRKADKDNIDKYLEKLYAQVDKDKKVEFAHALYKMGELNRDRSTVNKIFIQSVTDSKNLNFEEIVLDGNAARAICESKSEITDKLLDGIVNNRVLLTSDLSYFNGYLYNALEKKLESGDWLKIYPYVVSWSLSSSSFARDRRFFSSYFDPFVKKMEKQNTSEVIYLATTQMLKRVTDLNARKTISIFRSKAAGQIENLIPVDKSDKKYDLYVATESLSLGDYSKAWKLTQPKVDLLTQNWAEFEEDYVVWVTGQLLEDGQTKQALQLAMTVLLEEATLTKKTVTDLALIKGDIYRVQENYPAARIEYQALVNHPENKQTEAGQQARYRLIDLMILIKDYTSAEMQLARLADSSSAETQAEANYYLAKLYYNQKEYITANDYLQKTFKIKHGHVASRLLEGELKLHLPRGLADTEIAVGRLDLQTVVIPGSVLTLKLQDRNLAIARGGKAIPVDVVTSSGDKESLSLLPSDSDTTLFVGEMPTVLGEISAGNGKLEIRGEDRIFYAISEEFQKQNKIDYPRKEMVIKANAKLTVSSGEITGKKKEKSEELISKRNNLKSTQIRPGSPVYVEVKDFDRDLTEKPDEVFVDITTRSGDVLSNFKLTETGNHTGIFKAEVTTGVPYPLVTTSDVDENQDPNAVINSNRNAVWSSIADSKKPKWLEVDTMSSYLFKDVELKLAEQNVKSLMLFGQLDEDQFLIGSYPQVTNAEGGLQVQSIDTSFRTKQDFDRALKFVSESSTLKSPQMLRLETKYKDRDRWVTTSMKGTFWMKESREMTIKFLHKGPENNSQWTVLYLNGQRVLGRERMLQSEFDSTRTIFLKKGPNKLEVYNLDNNKDAEIKVGILQDDGSYKVLPEEWFSTAENPGLADILKPKGVLTKTETGFKLDLTEPVRLRKLRWSFNDYTGASIKVAAVSANNDKGGVILPVKEDFTASTTNETLEISAGDQILIRYNDEKRLGKALAVLEQSMNATFANAKIAMLYEIEDDKNGADAIRVRKGDQVLIKVMDFDEDRTLNRDSVTALVKTRSGSKMELKLLETESNSGEFVQILAFGSKTDKDTIAIEDNDVVTVSYLDSENNSPGIPTERIVKVETPILGQPELTVYSTSISKIEDNSSEAEARKKRIMTLNPALENVVLYKNQVIVKDEHASQISLNGPLLLKVLYPQVVKHSKSLFKIEVASESGIKAAQNDSSFNPYIEVEMNVGNISGAGYNLVRNSMAQLQKEDAMEIGQLTAAVKLQLGRQQDILETRRSDYKTLAVTGNDSIHVRLKDDQGKVVKEEKIKLLSDATLVLLDRNYNYPVEAIHMGQRFYVQVVDPDQDSSPERDSIEVSVQVQGGAVVKQKLTETLNHSGIFSGFIKPEFLQGPQAKKMEGKVYSGFGDELTFTYNDSASLSGKSEITVKGKIYKGADGSMSVFTKRFKDEEMAVKTRFLMAEALFEMAREHRKLKKVELADKELAQGKRILQEAIRDYPNSSLKMQGEYLLANLAQELKKYEEAISRYSRVISNWPDSEFSPKAQFKKAICLEKMNFLDKAAQEYVKVTYLYPKSDLTPDAVIRMASLYFKQKKYEVASKIYQRFQKNYPDDRLASKAYFMAANCLILAQKDIEEANAKLPERSKDRKRVSYVAAIEILIKLIDVYKDDKKMRPEAMYWLGDCQYKNREYTASYQTFKKLTWDYPEDKWAKIARGRLTDERFETFEIGKE